jgi:hypothetical protein
MGVLAFWAFCLLLFLAVAACSLGPDQSIIAKAGQMGDSFGMFNALASSLAAVFAASAYYSQKRQFELEIKQLQEQRKEDSLSRMFEQLPFFVIHTRNIDCDVVYEIENHGEMAFEIKINAKGFLLYRVIDWNQQNKVGRTLDLNGDVSYPALQKGLREAKLDRISIQNKPLNIDEKLFFEQMSLGDLNVELKISYQLANGFPMQETIEMPKLNASATSRRSEQCFYLIRNHGFHAGIQQQQLEVFDRNL